jgi:hypothetical protein
MIDDGRKRVTSWLIDDLMIERCGAKPEDEIHRRLRHASWPQLQTPSGALEDKTTVVERSLMAFPPLRWMPLKAISLLTLSHAYIMCRPRSTLFAQG